jgi:signal peptidase II
MRRSGLLWLGLGAAAATIVLDQITKWVMLGIMLPRTPPVIEVTSFFNLVLAWNRGVSFSMLHSEWSAAPWLLAVAALVIVAGLLVWLTRIGRFWPALGLGLIIGGALGNVIDRFRFGAVADFIQVHWQDTYYFPAFNVADSGITVGVVLLIIDGLFAHGEGSKIDAGGDGPRPVGEKTESRSS